MMLSFDNHLALQRNVQKLPLEKAHLPSARNLKSSLVRGMSIFIIRTIQ